MSVPAGIAIESAINKQAVALSVIKQNAQTDQRLASILEQAVQNVPTSSVRGTNVSTSA